MSLEIAVNLTTGKVYSHLAANNITYDLVILLKKYDEYFSYYSFNIEILDKSFIETMIHYHGYIVINNDNIEKYNAFLKDWREMYGFFKCEKITNLENWINYMTKQEHILELSYDKIKHISITKGKLPSLPKTKLKYFNVKKRSLIDDIGTKI